MLELGTALPTGRGSSPVIGPENVVEVGAVVDHRLDGENVPWAHDALGFVLSVVRHVGRAVEVFAYAMAAVGLHYAAFVLACHSGDDWTHVAVECAWADQLLRLLKAVVGRAHEALRVLIALADQEGLVEVRVEAVFVHAHVQVDDISFFDHAAVRDPVADDLVRRHAQRLPEVPITYELLPWSMVSRVNTYT